MQSCLLNHLVEVVAVCFIANDVDDLVEGRLRVCLHVFVDVVAEDAVVRNFGERHCALGLLIFS